MKGRQIMTLIISLLLVGCSLILYAHFIEPKRLVVGQHSLTANKQSSETVRIVQFSDVHLSRFFTLNDFEKVIHKINAQKPDLIVFTGDLFDNFSQYGPSEAADLLGQLNAPLGKFAVYGNHDYGGGAAQGYHQVMNAGGFTVLLNEGRTVATTGGHQLFLAGVDDGLLGNAALQETFLTMPKSDYSILLAHEPDLADYLTNENVQLVLSGHSHGGQVKLPFFTVKNQLAKHYTAGFYTLERPQPTKLYVSSGIGTTALPLRFGVPPRIECFDINL